MANAPNNLPIARLSVEIYAQIFDFADSPKDMVNLACTCKHIAHLVHGAVARHRTAYRTYRYTSDRDPATLVKLVRRLVLNFDPLVSHYFRSFDVWGARLSWADWRHFDVDKQGVKLSSDVVSFDPFTPREMSQLRLIARRLIDESDLVAAYEELHNGGDGLLKVLIIASAPRIESLKFIRRNDLAHKSCQEWLFKSICHRLSLGPSWLPGSDWPIGMRSLRDVAVGVDAGILDESIEFVHEDLLPAWEGPAEVSALMRLPALRSLYYHTAAIPLGYDCDEDPGSEDGSVFRAIMEPETPRDSSHLAQIYLDGVRGGRHDNNVSEFYVKLLGMPHDLRSCAVRIADGEWDVSSILFALADYQEHCLQKMMFYNPASLVGYRCWAYRPEDMPRAPLTMWWQCTKDVGLQALSEDEREATREDVVMAFLQYMHRQTAEVIILDGPLAPALLDEPSQAKNYYEHAILELLRSAGKQNLKALFIDFPHEADADGDLESPDGFAKVIRLAEELDVDLYGSKHLKTRKRHTLEFPMAPTRWDIATGPDFGKRIEQGFTAYDCVNDRWTTPDDDEHGWNYSPLDIGA
ncbi:hypothetical protein NLU13_7704 [Sarocladium strictum]|uniref:F-box domain-containing protein n=1 Tax=Sarocladium strictum TaxID=5046 RepID=A0AA39GFN7_SARSR|nr:hypothetical protein NLU13_7704 [Sarocladium strictum]